MPRKRMSYTKMFNYSTEPIKALYPILNMKKRLTQKSKSKSPQKPPSLFDIRNMTRELSPSKKGLNPLAKPFYPTKSKGKKPKKTKKRKTKRKLTKRRRR